MPDWTWCVAIGGTLNKFTRGSCVLKAFARNHVTSPSFPMEAHNWGKGLQFLARTLEVHVQPQQRAECHVWVGFLSFDLTSAFGGSWLQASLAGLLAVRNPELKHLGCSGERLWKPLGVFS